MSELWTYILLLIGPMLLGLWTQANVTQRFRQWATVPASSRMSGAQRARALLDAHGLHDVGIECVHGRLSDHYDPQRRVVALSDEVFCGNSIASVSVAAHECGHAIQHARRYAPMTLRSAIYPAVAFSMNTWMILLVVGALLGLMGLVQLAIALYALAVVFHLVTLPVEFDASRRGKEALVRLGVLGPHELGGSQKMLTAAAMTYVAAALTAVTVLVYYLMHFFTPSEQ